MIPLVAHPSCSTSHQAKSHLNAESRVEWNQSRRSPGSHKTCEIEIEIDHANGANASPACD
jgi:hypothetical protein